MCLVQACTLFILSGILSLQSEPETDTVSPKYLSRIDEAISEQKWEALFLLYEEGLNRHRYRVAPDPGKEGIQVGMVQFLIRRFSGLPQKAYEVYRTMRDAHADQALQAAFQEKDTVALDHALSLYFFSSISDTYLDLSARYLQENGRFQDSLLYWDRLLRYYPDSDIPREIILARMAVACRLEGSASRLAQVKAFAREGVGQREIRAGREKVSLSTFLASIEIPSSSPPVEPSLRLPVSSRFRDPEPSRFVRNDLLIWKYDFSEDEKTKKVEPSSNRTRLPYRTPSPQDYPLRPAYCRIKGKSYVLFTNGYRVVAVNPERVQNGSLTKGVYWKYPERGPIKVASPSRSFGVRYSRPYIGVTVQGEYAFATLYSSSRVSTNNRDLFSGPTRITCFHIPTGKVVWNTDGLYEETQKMERRAQQAYDFLDQNFAFSGPPLVRGDQVFVGVCTSPSAEQASRILCLDRASGSPKWCTFLVSYSQAGNRFGGRGRSVSPYLPMMVEEGGVLFVQTSLGMVGALRSTTGGILWLSRYQRNIRLPNWNSQAEMNIRPANDPLLFQGKLWILPQDAKELLAFDQQTGEAVSLPRVETKMGAVPWPEIKWLLGVIDDWMILGGASSYVLRLSDYRAHSLASANTSGCGRGQIVGEDVYLSIQSNGVGTLGLYGGIGSWRKIRTPDWHGENQTGNLLVAGTTLVVASDQIYFYTDVNSAKRRFAYRTRQSPPHLKSLLAYASLMESGGVWEEAVEAYLAYDRLVGSEDFPSEKVRDRIYEIYLKIGVKEGEASALQFFQRAKQFAPAPRKKARMEWKIADLLQKSGRNREAIDSCRELITLYPQYMFSGKQDGSVLRLREYASRMIAEIQQSDPEAYHHVERMAADALKAVPKGSLSGWREIRSRFPNSRAAVEANRLLLADRMKQEAWGEALVLLKENSSPEDPRPLFTLLERVEDWERLVSGIKRWSLDFGNTVLMASGKNRPVHEIATQWLQRISEKMLPSREGSDGPLVPVGQTMENSAEALLSPLEPQGILPPSFPSEGVLLQAGSSVELRDLYDGSRKWKVPYPFGYSGLQIRGEAGAFSIRSVDQDSPAARAGLSAGDILVEINGLSPTPSLLSRLLSSGSSGSVISLRVKRKDSVLAIALSLETAPPEKGPSVLGASWTQGYDLAIVWPKVVVAVDIHSGEQKWAFSLQEDPFTIQALRGGDGLLFLQGMAEKKGRLLCLEDPAGTVRWIREYVPVNPGGQRDHVFASYFDGPVSLLQVASSGKSELGIFDRTHGVPLRDPVVFPQGILSHAMDENAGVLHVLQGVVSVRNRQLKGISLLEKNPGAELYAETLAPKDVGNDLRGSRLYAREPHVVLMIPAGNPRGKPGVHVFDVRSERFVYSIPVPRGRAFSKGLCEGLPIDAEGVLYLYSETVTTEPGGRSGFLSAYILGETPLLKWESISPALPSSTSARWRVDTRRKNHVLFSTLQGAVPGERGERFVSALYSKVRGGYLQQVFSDLDDRLGWKAISLDRGRTLLGTSEGVQIYSSP